MNWHFLQDRSVFLERAALVALIAFFGLVLRFLLVSGASRWLHLRGLLPKDVSLKRIFYPPILVVIFGILLQLTLPLFSMPPRLDVIAAHTAEVLILSALTWFLLRAATLARRVLNDAFDVSRTDNLRQRRVRTQIDFIYRMVVALLCVLGISAVLLTFESARRIGTSLIASAGLASVVIGIGAQKSVGSFFAGFQIAFTQPIRLDDVVIVENEWGRVEEITLTYVVIRLWDLRRLILPINYFIEKPFQNWTRNSAELLGSVFLYVDYTAPVDPVREEAKRCVADCALWDKKTCIVQITNASERTMEVRILVSARNASDLFDLRCVVREHLIAFLQERSPTSLPRERFEGPQLPPVT